LAAAWRAVEPSERSGVDQAAGAASSSSSLRSAVSARSISRSSAPILRRAFFDRPASGVPPPFALAPPPFAAAFALLRSRF